jgi:hypothetical protein
MEKQRVMSLVLCFAIFICMVQLVSATETHMIIETLSNHSVNINFLNPDRAAGGDILLPNGAVTENSGDSGIISFDFSSGAKSFDLSVFLMEKDKVLMHEESNNIAAGTTIYMLLIPGVDAQLDTDYHENKTTVVQNEETVTDNLTTESPIETFPGVPNIDNSEKENVTSTTGAGISGFATANTSSEGFFSKLTSNKYVYYIIGGILLLAIIIFILFKFVFKKKNPEIRVKKLSELQREKEEESGVSEGFDDLIKSAEGKINEAQEEIRRLRGSSQGSQQRTGQQGQNTNQQSRQYPPQ